ncbi:pyridoxal phosphate-dependent transferase [Mortierella sp. GBAus27b]|nr:pyridoxal phosphate-dependent transferase [Mortierella sp. GBAus27b]
MRSIDASAPVSTQELPSGHSPHKIRTINSLAYGSRYTTEDIPKFRLPTKGTEPIVAYQLIHDELDHDGKPNANLASFVHTWMEPEADKLVMENINKNLADQWEYPATMKIHARCISILGNMWRGNGAIGTATVGSSEAVMLGGLAMKKRWQAARRDKGLDTSKPNIVMGSNVQVALEKFARYFDVECRMVPVSEKSHHCLDPNRISEFCDENTIGVYVILGSTYTGHFEDVEAVSNELDIIQASEGWDIPIHVDAASGGFIAPFAFPNLRWGFELDRVKSINASGHKYGLSYAGIGWVLWKNEKYLPEELVFTTTILGSEEKTFTLNFSRPACFMIAQYYNFVRLGTEGYTSIAQNDLENARALSVKLERTGRFDVVSDMHRPKGVFGVGQGKDISSDATIEYNPALPVVAFKLTDNFKKKHPHVKQAALSTLLLTRNWIIPNYKLPKDEDTIEILRIVVRESFTRDLVDTVVEDIIWATNALLASGEIDVKALGRGNDQLVDAQRPDIGDGHVSDVLY